MIEPLAPALDRVRDRLLDPDSLIRALAGGRRKGQRPSWTRVELRYVDLKAGRRLQITRYDDTQAHVANHGPEDAPRAVDELLAEPFGNWHVETAAETLQLRVTKGGEAAVGTTAGPGSVPERSHDRSKARMLPEDDPVLVALGISDADGRVKPSRRAKYRQVEEFLRELGASIDDALAAVRLRPTAESPLQVVDLGCGNAYLTFAAHAWLTRVRGLPVRLVGVDVKEQSRAHNTGVAERLGVADQVTFVVAGIDDVVLETAPDVVLALHACDTATDDALARGIGWEATLILAAPCCHKDISRQLRERPAPAPYTLLTRDGILRERLADTLTDALRAALLRTRGYRTDVVEFVDSEHTPRNTLIRAVATGSSAPDDEYVALTSAWQVRPRLAELLG
ncbi:SAM-dependent methyltransferase [Nocardioides marmoriginsengisoli]|uniref:SAM-dependent methyltransferase n=1 Tax=Nocardioides marmoriginsengisoli TaxID=661483 RepID=A0A3N0CRS7_9ACTN|nr:SAM-dependent methyltransferase [Nocardioides marmoriginsengisoli]RNL66167.1 SAM-dependent methyltransferase [Nocardioides marmoriginsengisoli]